MDVMFETARLVLRQPRAGDAAHIRCGAFDFNRASLAIQKKLGFVEIGTGTLHCLARREDLRHIDTELTRARWAERQP